MLVGGTAWMPPLPMAEGQPAPFPQEEVWAQLDLNQRPAGYEPAALTTELWAHPGLTKPTKCQGDEVVAVLRRPWTSRRMADASQKRCSCGSVVSWHAALTSVTKAGRALPARPPTPPPGERLGVGSPSTVTRKGQLSRDPHPTYGRVPTGNGGSPRSFPPTLHRWHPRGAWSQP